jgi:hypothetical protein
MQNLSLSQQFEIAKTRQILEQATAEQLRELYLELLEYHYSLVNVANSLLVDSLVREHFEEECG